MIAKSYARIAWQNLANFGVLPLEFARWPDRDRIARDDVLVFREPRRSLLEGAPLAVRNQRSGEWYEVVHGLDREQVETVLRGGLLNVVQGDVG